MRISQLLASAAIVALANALTTHLSTNSHCEDIAAQRDQQPLKSQGDIPAVGDKCTNNLDCALNSHLYCSGTKHTCQPRSGPGEACEVNDACFQGECRGGFCGGIPLEQPCSRDVDCASSLICRPDPLYIPPSYRFTCNYPAPKGWLGSICRSDSDCGFPNFCVLENGGLTKYCGINPQCVGWASPCSIDKDCCGVRCMNRPDSQGFDHYKCLI